jgi:branched-chain amino acid transport system substrate-binding protein
MVSYGDGRTAYKELVSGKMKNKTNILIILSIIIGLVGLYLILPSRFLSKNIYEIAVVSMSGERKEDGQSMLRGIRMHIDQVNAMGGIYGKAIQLRKYDDRGDPKLARQVASNIVENKKVRLVLGHFFSSTSFAAGQIYKKYGLPAITASATDPMVTQNNPWFFRVISTNTTQGQFIAAYIHGALKKKRASIVYDIDNYGTSLSRSFEHSASELGIHLVKKWRINSTKNVDSQVKKIVEQIRAIKDTGIIFLATHSIEAVKLISAIKFPGSGYEIFGPDSLSTVSFMKEFLRFPQERVHPGYFSDNVYATSPFMINISPNPAAFRFRNTFRKKFGHNPTWIASSYYDAAQVAVSALKFSQMSGNNFRKDRMEIRKYIEKIDNPENAVKGITGDIYFDKFGNITRSFSVGRFQKQQYCPSFVQYQTIKETPDQDYPIDDIVNGNLALVNNQLMKKGRVIYAGIDINKISHLNLYDSCFEADFYLWFRFEGDFDDQNIVFMNATHPIALEKPIYEYQQKNFKSKTYHIKGIFKATLNFRMYPFDHQQLQIKFRHKDKTRDQVIYIPDISGMKHTGIKKSTDSNQPSQMKGWEIYKTDIYQSCLTRSSSFGNPSLFDQPRQISYSLISMDIGIQRDSLDTAFRTFAPLTVVILLIVLAACIPTNRFNIKTVILLSSLLSTMYYHSKLLSTLQSIKISFAESMVYVVYALICTGVILAIIRYIFYKKGFEKLLKGIFIVEFVAFPIVLFIFVYCFYGHYDIIGSNEKSIILNENIAIGEKVEKEDVLYWTFTIQNNQYSDGDIIGTINHKSYDAYTNFQILKGNDDNAFAIDKKGQISILDLQQSGQQELSCRELIISSSNYSGKSLRSVVNICLDNDQDVLQKQSPRSLKKKNKGIENQSRKKPSKIQKNVRMRQEMTMPSEQDAAPQTTVPEDVNQTDRPGKGVFRKNQKINRQTDMKQQNVPDEIEQNRTNEPLRKNAKKLSIMDQIFIIPKNIANNKLAGRIKVLCPEKDQLSFRIVSGNEKNIFFLHSESGSLFIKDNSNLNGTDAGTYFLTVEVINQDNKTDRASITVLINR